MKPAAGIERTSSRAACPEEAAFLDLVRTTEMLSRPLTQLLKTEDLSANQYNVLRILRGSPDALTCGEVGNRMITKDPDITRLLDRLEKRGLVSRCRESKDRRVVLTHIAPEGLKLLARLDGPIQDTHRHLLRHVGQDGLRTLTRLLAAARSGLE